MSEPREPEKSDASLLRRFRSGEQDAATQLYLRYARRLQGLAVRQTGTDLQSRIDPEDIVQSVFRTFFRRAREGHYEVPDGDELWKLFLVIGLHKIRDAAAFHRAARRSVARTTAAEDAGELSEVAAADSLAEVTLRMVIDEVLQKIPESHRRIILLRLDGEPVDSISQLTDRSRRTVERTLQKFREELQIHVQQVLPEQQGESPE